ncbi:MAG TPA: hypothetical protein DEQ14_04050, partial [Treponema sp.]|nr:hypothetical protein [Treponema sp.]
ESVPPFFEIDFVRENTQCLTDKKSVGIIKCRGSKNYTRNFCVTVILLTAFYFLRRKAVIFC